MSQNKQENTGAKVESSLAHKNEVVLERELKPAHRRAQELIDRINSSPLGQQEVVQEAVEELATALEELTVTEEELRNQNEELLATRSELEAQRLRYEDLFESAPDGYLVTGNNGVIRKANRAAAEMLGVQQKFLTGKPLGSYIADADRAAFGVIASGLDSPSRPTRPDVLISDIAMPGEDGFDLIRALRKLEPERGGRIPAIALTAYAGDDDRSQVLIEGYQMHLAKPVALTPLVAAVANLAGKNAKSTTHSPQPLPSDTHS